MDPNTTLREIRELISGLDPGSEVFDAWDIVSRVEDLDEWLTKGGALPSDWLVSRENRIRRSNTTG